MSTIDNEPPPLSNEERRRIARVLLTHAVDCDRLGHSVFAMLLEDTALSILRWPIDARDARTAADLALHRHMYHEDIAWPWAIVAVELGGI